ncbi:MAG: hypothetical protein K1X89_07405 [Myxococcaceae bacterium]|nr:hypothetical protein [Myxococcaceae bacterium]
MSPVPLSEAHAPGRFGGKAAALAKALGHGLPVPRGLALDVEAVRALACEPGGGLDLVPLLEETFGRAAVLAVRSAAVGEDGVRASFAGQLLSKLGCRISEVAAAVAAVHASADGAAAYARRRGEQVRGVVAVVQPVVAARAAGVLFTRDPVSGAPGVLVEAAQGLGPVVVDGSVIPDRWRLSASGTVLHHEPGLKDLRLELRGGGVEELRGPADPRPALTGDDLGRLADLAARCQAVFGEAIDLEFAFDDSTLWLLQARPITTVPT